MANGELLEIEPLELKFHLELKKSVSCSLQLSNKTEGHVAFKVKTTNPKKYCVRPNTGVIPPLSTCAVIVTMQTLKEIPADLNCKDKFLVQSIVANAGLTVKDITAEMFSKDSGNAVEDCKLKVVHLSAPQPPSLFLRGPRRVYHPEIHFLRIMDLQLLQLCLVLQGYLTSLEKNLLLNRTEQIWLQFPSINFVITTITFSPTAILTILASLWPVGGSNSMSSSSIISPTGTMWAIRPSSCRKFLNARSVQVLLFRSDGIRIVPRLTVRSDHSTFRQPCWSQHDADDGRVSRKPSISIPNAVSGLRRHSTTADLPAAVGVGDKALKSIYMQGVVKPLVEEDEDLVEVAIKKSEDGCGVVEEEDKEVEEERVLEKEVSEVEKEAWRFLNKAVVNYCGSPVGTVAANDPAAGSQLNYDQVFIRDFVPSALAFLLKGEHEIVRNFLLHTLQLQSWEKTVDCYSPGQGLMPASFKVRSIPLDGSNEAFEEVLDPDFGEAAIGRVAPVDSGLWWIILLRAYGRITGDYALQERVDVQTGIKLILNLCLTDGFDMFPSLLVTDGSCMIDRRMGIHGHPLEIQALFYSALRCSREVITVNDGSKNLLRAINNRLSALSFHIREYYWVDMKKINEIYRYKTEEYSHDAINKFNIYPDQIPSWLADWIPDNGGYMIGNLQPAHMDFRFFSLGNLWAIISSLTTPRQAEGILNLIEEKWDDLIANMPLKICYPALESEEWRIITGSDPKNTSWSYHNGGSWPTLLWQFTLACIKMGRPELAQKAISIAEQRLSADKWPEYYDTQKGKFIGKQSRLYQTWTIAGFLTSKMLLENPELASILTCDEDMELLEGCACSLNKSPRIKCSRHAAKSQFLI